MPVRNSSIRLSHRRDHDRGRAPHRDVGLTVTVNVPGNTDHQHDRQVKKVILNLLTKR
jgi:hypothetical protein